MPDCLKVIPIQPSESSFTQRNRIETGEQYLKKKHQTTHKNSHLEATNTSLEKVETIYKVGPY